MIGTFHNFPTLYRLQIDQKTLKMTNNNNNHYLNASACLLICVSLYRRQCMSSFLSVICFYLYAGSFTVCKVFMNNCLHIIGLTIGGKLHSLSWWSGCGAIGAGSWTHSCWSARSQETGREWSTGCSEKLKGRRERRETNREKSWEFKRAGKRRRRRERSREQMEGMVGDKRKRTRVSQTSSA